MAERTSLWVTGGIDQEEARVGTGAAWYPATNAVKARTGLRPGSGNPALVAASGTPDANITVNPFQAVLQGTRAGTAGTYILTLDSAKTINVLSTPAHASLARRDLIIAHQADVFYGDGNSDMTVRQVVGTPSGSPADPSLAAYPDSITLARVAVNAAATTITAANITDLRPAGTVALGGLLPVASQTLRNALTGLYDGIQIYRTDRDWVEIYDGTTWRVQGVGIVSSTADLSAVTNPATGQLAYNTGDALTYRYTGTEWRAVAYRTSQTLVASTPSVTFSAIPTYLKTLRLICTARTDGGGGFTDLRFRVNANATSNYRVFNRFAGQTLGADPNPPGVATSGIISYIPTGASPANVYGSGILDIVGWDAPHAACLTYQNHGGFADDSASVLHAWGVGNCAFVGPYTSLTVLPAAGNFVAGSEFVLTGTE